MKYLQNKSRSELEDILNICNDNDIYETSTYIEPSVIKTSNPKEVLYNYRRKVYENKNFRKDDYCSIYCLKEGDFEYNAGSTSNQIEYSKNNENWILYSTPVHCEEGDVIRLRGNNASYYNTKLSYSGYFILYGNTDSLINSDENDVFGVSTYSNRVFQGLFSNNDTLISIKNLVINANSASCCRSMFSNCHRLIDVLDVLRNPTGTYAYASMFENCNRISNSDNLTISVNFNYCCQAMFRGCSSMNSVPNLNIVSMDTYALDSMFAGCSNLSDASSITISSTNSYCCRSMFSGCNNLTKLPSFEGSSCTSYCFQCMFENCNSLKTIPKSVFKLYKPKGSAKYSFGHMFRGCINLKTIELLPYCRYISEYACYGMFYGCEKLEHAAPFKALYIYGNYAMAYMFFGCKNLQSYILFPDAYAYYTNGFAQMFGGCTSLTQIVYWGEPHATMSSNWLSNISPHGVFYCTKSELSFERSSNGVPSGWTIQDIDFSDWGLEVLELNYPNSDNAQEWLTFYNEGLDSMSKIWELNTNGELGYVYKSGDDLYFEFLTNTIYNFIQSNPPKILVNYYTPPKVIFRQDIGEFIKSYGE